MRIQSIFIIAIMLLFASCRNTETVDNSTTQNNTQVAEKTEKKQSEPTKEEDGEIYGFLGLYWLADHQNEDGSWSANGFHSECGKTKQPQQINHRHSKNTYEFRLKREGKCTNKDGSDDSGKYFSDELTTAFALYAFLTAGYDSESGSLAPVVKNGVDCLIDKQQKTGGFANVKDEYFMMTNALSTIVVANNCGLTGNETYKPFVQKAMEFIINQQVKDEKGEFSGWGMKHADNIVNPIATGWVYIALHAGRFQNIKVPEHCWDGISNYFKSITTIKDGVATVDPKMDYMPKGSKKYKRMPICEAIAAYCNLREQNSYKGLDEYFKSLVLPIVQPETSFSTDKYKIDYMYWYFMTATRFHFQTYFERDLYNVQFALQRMHEKDKGKCVYGSWDPIDVWGEGGGRVFSTAMNIILDQLYRIARYGVRYNGLYSIGKPVEDKPKKELSEEDKKERKKNEWKLLKELHR